VTAEALRLEDKAWDAAKARARERRPDLEEDSDHFYRLAVTIYDRGRRPRRVLKALGDVWGRLMPRWRRR